MTMNEEMKQLLNEVDTLKVQLSTLRPLPEEALKKVQDALDIEYTYESNRIEGNTLTLQETALVVNEGVTISGKSMREHLEAINHSEAIDYIKDIAKTYKFVSERIFAHNRTMTFFSISVTVPLPLSAHFKCTFRTLICLFRPFQSL